MFVKGNTRNLLNTWPGTQLMGVCRQRSGQKGKQKQNSLHNARNHTHGVLEEIYMYIKQCHGHGTRATRLVSRRCQHRPGQISLVWAEG